MVLRILRAARRSLEDDGLIGRITESVAYRTLQSVRMMVWVALGLLWIVEVTLGKYLMDPMARFMASLDPDSPALSPLGEALRLPAVEAVNAFVLGWIFLDLVRGLVYYVLEKFTLDEFEKAQRQYDKDLKTLGVDEKDNDKDTNQDKAKDGEKTGGEKIEGTDDNVDAKDGQKTGGVDGDEKTNVIISIGESRLFMYLVWAVLAFQIFGDAWIVGNAISDDLETYRDMNSGPGPAETHANLARINPWRDLIPEHDPVLRELIYMHDVLRELTPTTLPGDDYQHFSDLIRSLETRTDMSWRVFEESDIRQTMLAAANRDSGSRTHIAKEPFSINQRVKALFRHWEKLALEPGKPGRWEDASDTTFLAPLISAHPFGEQTNEQKASGKLTLTPEQEAMATKVYTKWRRDRDRKASYLKLHPPTPIAWVPASKSDTGVRNAWDGVFEDGKIRRGRSVPAGKLAGSEQWKPIFGSLITQRVPFDWVAPGEVPMTDEESRASVDEMMADMDVVQARRKRQEEYMKELREAAENEKKEL